MPNKLVKIIRYVRNQLGLPVVCKHQSDIETKCKQLKLTNPSSNNYETITINLKTQY